MRIHLTITTAAGILLLAPLVRAAAPEWFEQTQEIAWKEAYDPTLISRRVYSEFSYENDVNDVELWKIENSLRWAVPICDGLAFGVQVMVPVKWNDTPGSNESGVGDFELRPGIVGRLSPTLRYGFGMNAEFDTASDSALGANALVLRPIAAIRWDATDRLNLGINAEYSVTPCDAGAYAVSKLEMKFPLALKLNDTWSVAATYKPTWEFLTDDVTHRIELDATLVCGDHDQYAATFGYEFPVASDTLDFKLICGFAWYF